MTIVVLVSAEIVLSTAVKSRITCQFNFQLRTRRSPPDAQNNGTFKQLQFHDN